MNFSETSLPIYTNFCGKHCLPSHAPQKTHAAPTLGSVQGGAPGFDTFPSSLPAIWLCKGELCAGVLHGLFAAVADMVPNTLTCFPLAAANLLKLPCSKYIAYFI